MDKEAVLQRLRTTKEQSSSIRDFDSYESWRVSAFGTLGAIYGSDFHIINEITWAFKYSFRYKNKADEVRGAIQKIFQSLIDDIDQLGLPTQDSAQGDNLNINITNTQNQTTKVKLSVIVESISDELTGKQQKELQELIDDDELEPEKKKKSIVGKLKGFGSDVASNILANVLTNPKLFEL